MSLLQKILKISDWQQTSEIQKIKEHSLKNEPGALEVLKKLQKVCKMKGLGAPDVFSDESFPDINIVAEFIEGQLDEEHLRQEYEEICLHTDFLLAELGICSKLALAVNDIPVIIPRHCRQRLYYLAPSANIPELERPEYSGRFAQIQNDTREVEAPLRNNRPESRVPDDLLAVFSPNIQKKQLDKNSKDRQNTSERKEPNDSLNKNDTQNLLYSQSFPDNKMPNERSVNVLNEPGDLQIKSIRYESNDIPNEQSARKTKGRARKTIQTIVVLLFMAVAVFVTCHFLTGGKTSDLPGGSYIEKFASSNRIGPVFDDAEVTVQGSISVPAAEPIPDFDIAINKAARESKTLVSDKFFEIPEKNNAVFSTPKTN